MSLCYSSVQQPGGTVIFAGTTNINGLAGQGCSHADYSDKAGGAPPKTVDHDGNPLPRPYGAGGAGHHFPANPYTSNPEPRGNSGEDGAVIIWW